MIASADARESQRRATAKVHANHMHKAVDWLRSQNCGFGLDDPHYSTALAKSQGCLLSVYGNCHHHRTESHR